MQCWVGNMGWKYGGFALFLGVLAMNAEHGGTAQSFLPDAI